MNHPELGKPIGKALVKTADDTVYSPYILLDKSPLVEVLINGKILPPLFLDRFKDYRTTEKKGKESTLLLDNSTLSIHSSRNLVLCKRLADYTAFNR